MKAQEMKEMTVTELRETLNKLEEEYFNLKVRKATQELDNPLVLRQIRRSIARAKTILRAHEKGILTLAGSSES